MTYQDLRHKFDEFEIRNSVNQQFKRKKYNILNPYSERRISKFENDFNIKLPKDFRAFITTYSKGILNNESPSLNILDKVDIGSYRKGSNIYNPSIEFSEHDNTNGIIHLNGAGCGSGFLLVVNGNESGNIWFDNMSEEKLEPFINGKENKSIMNFNNFIYQRLEEALKYL